MRHIGSVFPFSAAYVVLYFFGVIHFEFTDCPHAQSETSSIGCIDLTSLLCIFVYLHLFLLNGSSFHITR